MNDNLARIVGPPVGAVVYAQLGIEGVAVINAASFLVAALLVRAVGAGRWASTSSTGAPSDRRRT